MADADESARANPKSLRFPFLKNHFLCPVFAVRVILANSKTRFTFHFITSEIVSVQCYLNYSGYYDFYLCRLSRCTHCTGVNFEIDSFARCQHVATPPIAVFR